MERLTERFSNGQAAVYGCGNNCKYDFKYCNNHLEDCPTINEIYEKLATYEDLEEQGKLLMLPCKVGDTVYTIYSDEDGCFIEKSIVQEVSTHRIWIDDRTYYKYSDFGKTVFLTQAEAQAALENMEGGKITNV